MAQALFSERGPDAEPRRILHSFSLPIFQVIADDFLRLSKAEMAKARLVRSGGGDSEGKEREAVF